MSLWSTGVIELNRLNSWWCWHDDSISAYPQSS